MLDGWGIPPSSTSTMPDHKADLTCTPIQIARLRAHVHAYTIGIRSRLLLYAFTFGALRRIRVDARGLGTATTKELDAPLPWREHCQARVPYGLPPWKESLGGM